MIWRGEFMEIYGLTRVRSHGTAAAIPLVGAFDERGQGDRDETQIPNYSGRKNPSFKLERTIVENDGMDLCILRHHFRVATAGFLAPV
jgi:hypothetical protein